MDKPAEPEVIPYIAECEIFYEGGPSAADLSEECSKNPGHKNFIPVKEFDKRHLPEGYKTEKVLECLNNWCDRTVKVCVNYTSPDRPETYPNCTRPYPYHSLREGVSRSGTGYFWWNWESVKGELCPCPLCQKSDKPETEFYKVTVHTATHVVYDNAEAAHTVCEVFYDAEPGDEKSAREVKRKMKPVYGVKIIGKEDEASRLERIFSDNVIIECVTHDKDLKEMLSGIEFAMFDIPGPPYGVIISHPHGQSKTITIGKMLYRTISIPDSDKAENKDFFNFGPGAKLRFSQNNPAAPTSDSIQELLVKSGLPFKSSAVDEYTLEEGMAISLPQEATFLCQFQYSQHVNPWVTFPKGTKFVPTPGAERKESAPSSASTFQLPENMEVNFENVTTVLPVKWIRPFYFTYDISTCPGCSGALVLHSDGLTHTHNINHTGHLPDGTSCNRSAIRRYTYQ